jgi:Beta-ketoacyl synthase, N-terminal domain
VTAVFVNGYGAVSPAGWGAASLRLAVQCGEPLPTKELRGSTGTLPLRVRSVPACPERPAFLSHPRLRRTSPIAQYAVAAALEALGSYGARLTGGSRLGVIFCATAGCVKYSQRFYDETLKDPATASPLVFPETVFNAPASHLAALLGTNALNYTLVGDPGTFLQALALAADWLLCNRVDGCLVIGAEELDWLVSEAFCLFDPDGIVSEGAGALYLSREPDNSAVIQLQAITDPELFSRQQSRAQAARRARAQLPSGGSEDLLCDGCQGIARLDRAESNAWHDWTGARLSPQSICGEAFMAGAAWRCVLGVDALAQRKASNATISVVGCNQQAVAARFVLNETRGVPADAPLASSSSS